MCRFTSKQELCDLHWVLPGNLPAHPSQDLMALSRVRVGGWASPGDLVTSIPVLLSSQRRAELHWEDFQRGGAAGVFCVREFIPPKAGHGAWLS